MAERLRRWTRNPLGSPWADSNPADCVHFSIFFSCLIIFLVPWDPVVRRGDSFNQRIRLARS